MIVMRVAWAASLAAIVLCMPCQAPAQALWSSQRGWFLPAWRFDGFNLPALADLDGDGYLDVAASYGRALGVLWGHSDGNPGSVALLPAPSNGVVWNAVAGDVNADGLPDLVAAFWPNGGPGGALVFVNQGGRQFQLDQANRLQMPASTRSEAAALLDFDHDGDLDALLAVYSGQDLLFENDGNGYFTDVTATHMSSVSLPSVAYLVVDLDRDGWEDVVVAAGGYSAAQNVIYWNDAGVLRDAGSPCVRLVVAPSDRRTEGPLTMRSIGRARSDCPPIGRAAPHGGLGFPQTLKGAME